MTTQSDAVRRFTDAWKCGDDDTINQITIEITQSGNDADIVAMSRVMAKTTYASSK
ncbi:hypothetical protein [Streptomyces cyanogenus]|uniref:Uncharacterized protein n=1 Tax=Streptomyces cyanogenus TaxID=80860 RepID=A0ABX7TJZ9_STRCY|nr:hypothetical protein [Streptomyces cyanogenus]QTD96992.1 hypothetical protein S1361_06485 [Streptomyces cyanogenus]